VIYAPQAESKLGGTGANNLDFQGACVAKVIVMDGTTRAGWIAMLLESAESLGKRASEAGLLAGQKLPDLGAMHAAMESLFLRPDRPHTPTRYPLQICQRREIMPHRNPGWFLAIAAQGALAREAW